MTIVSTSGHAPLPILYSPAEVAAHLRISVRTVKRFIASGKLATLRFGRAVLITDEELRRFLREGTGKKEPESRSKSKPRPAQRSRSQLDRRRLFELARETAARRR